MPRKKDCGVTKTTTELLAREHNPIVHSYQKRNDGSRMEPLENVMKIRIFQNQELVEFSLDDTSAIL